MFLTFDQIRREIKLWVFLPSLLLFSLKNRTKQTTSTHKKSHSNFAFMILLKFRENSIKQMDFLQLSREYIKRMADLRFSDSWEVRLFKEFEVIIAMHDANYLYGCVQLEKPIFSMSAPDIL